MTQTLNRRDLLLLGINRRQRSVDLSCEWLYMKYCDTLLDSSTQDLFDRLEFELRSVDTIRLMDAAWLTRLDFKDWLEPILTSVRARGGQITHSSETAKSSH
ncbi:MAG TPA: hypothetical protein VK709_03405 [Candidatus Saccharimonadales bacterium]|jgi:hypothetical protein|nr:hypothetical protein [Candidatus Saccharimonadales bacterium]